MPTNTGVQFYVTEKDVGKNRAEVSAAQLQDLNPYVNIHVHVGALTPDVLNQFQVFQIRYDLPWMAVNYLNRCFRS